MRHSKRAATECARGIVEALSAQARKDVRKGREELEKKAVWLGQEKPQIPPSKTTLQQLFHAEGKTWRGFLTKAQMDALSHRGILLEDLERFGFAQRNPLFPEQAAVAYVDVEKVIAASQGRPLSAGKKRER